MKDGPLRPAWEWPTTFLNWLDHARQELDHLPFTHTYYAMPAIGGILTGDFYDVLQDAWYRVVQPAIDKGTGWTFGLAPSLYPSAMAFTYPDDGYVVSLPGSSVRADSFPDWINWISATSLLRESEKVWFGGWSPEPGVIHHELSIVFNHLPLAKEYARQWSQREIWALHSNTGIPMGGDSAPYVDPFGTHGTYLLQSVKDTMEIGPDGRLYTNGYRNLTENERKHLHRTGEWPDGIIEQCECQALTEDVDGATPACQTVKVPIPA